MANKSERIAELNDAFRNSMGQGGRVLMTAGIQALSPEEKLLIFNLVKTFNDFSESNDPYGEHDFGTFDFKDERVFWKIDYYDNDMECGSEDPSDPSKTTRGMTVMMAYEY